MLVRPAQRRDDVVAARGAHDGDRATHFLDGRAVAARGIGDVGVGDERAAQLGGEGVEIRRGVGRLVGCGVLRGALIGGAHAISS